MPIAALTIKKANMIYELLKKAAEDDRPCPTNTDMAKSLDMIASGSFTFMLKYLVLQGKIKIAKKGKTVVRKIQIVENEKWTDWSQPGYVSHPVVVPVSLRKIVWPDYGPHNLKLGASTGKQPCPETIVPRVTCGPWEEDRC